MPLPCGGMGPTRRVYRPYCASGEPAPYRLLGTRAAEIDGLGAAFGVALAHGVE